MMRLINKEINDGNLEGVKISSTAPPLLKLCYVDDVLLLCNARIDELATVKRCIERYCEWSSQEISLEKSRVFPSKGVSWQFLNQSEVVGVLRSFPKILNTWGCPCSSLTTEVKIWPT